MKMYKIISTIIILSIFTSCENEIRFDIKENTPKIVVNAMININFEENYIFVSKTGKDHTDSVDDATINIYVNDELREQLTQFIVPGKLDSIVYYNYHNPSDKKYKTCLRFNPGDKVKIEVFADNNKYHAWAEDIIPKPLDIDNIDTLSFAKDSATHIRLKTTFTDHPDEINFYRLAIVQKTTFQIKNTDEGSDTSSIVEEYEETIYIDTRQDRVLNNGKVSTDDDVVVQTENRYAVFDDKQLSPTYTMTTTFIRPDSYSYYFMKDVTVERVAVEFNVHLISITEMQYYYLKALNIIYDELYEEYFSMPVSFPSNVEGGVGFVGFSAGTYKTFNIPDIIPSEGEYGEHYPF